MPKPEAGKAEACCWCLSHCCILYGIFGVVLMTWFGFLVQNKSLTFQLAKAKQDNPDEWDYDKKAKACFSGAVLYAITCLISIGCRQMIKRAQTNRYQSMRD
ncbi:hypothetical protein DIPPA_22771 [Diplonema papillatum]|nr:hypothetical protein DIPPA_22771 [Diplonema papillatum]